MKAMRARSQCPISSALDIFGDKWSLLVIRDLIFSGKNTYGEFVKSDEKIATNILADRLSLLECVGIITKEEHPNSKAKYFYRLTHKGVDLMPILMEMIVWSDKYGDFPKEVKSFAQKIKKNRNLQIKQISSSIGQIA